MKRISSHDSVRTEDKADEESVHDERRPLTNDSKQFDSLKSYMRGSSTKRNVFIVVVVLIIGAIIATSITLGILLAFVPQPQIITVNKRLIDFDDIFNNNLSPAGVSPIWMNDDSFVTGDQFGNLLRYDTTTFQTTVLINQTSLYALIGNTSFGYGDFSPSGKFIFLLTNQTKLWRHSFTASYLVYDIENRVYFNLTNDGIPLSNVKWSSAHDDLVAFVRVADVFVKNLTSQIEVQVSFDGSLGEILNGICSWVYEEEVFSDYSALWWSNDDSKVAFMRFDETPVTIMTIPLYTHQPYTTYMNVRYPKPGYPNPAVSLIVYQLSSNQSITLNINGTQDVEYITYVTWMSNQLYVKTQNRLQNREYITSYSNFPSPQGNLLSTLTDSAWIDTQYIVELPELSCYVTLQPNVDNVHIAKYDMNGTFLQFLTSGSFDVTGIAGYYGNNQTLYFISAEISPTQRQLYGISAIDGSSKTRISLTDGWYSASFSDSGRYYILNYGGPNMPTSTLRSSFNQTLQVVLQNNSNVSYLLSDINMPNKTFFTVLTPEGEALNAYKILPPNFNPLKQYPVLMNVYGGPGSQTVMQAYENNRFHLYLASQLNIIIVSVDNRGTGARGQSFMKQTYLKLGELETIDQISVAKQLSNNFDYMDANRTGIWGWSYGGFMASSVLSTPGNPFRVGISVAPVTDWGFYDSVYTERYMRTPLLNPGGYFNTSVVKRASNVESGKFMLVHGTGDDNVHFQNSAELALGLIQNNIQFEAMYYPNYDHGISARRHLYKFLSNFLEENL